MVDVTKQVYTLDEVEELKEELTRLIYRGHNSSITRMIQVCYCLNLLGIEYNRETGMFEETELGGVDWLSPQATRELFGGVQIEGSSGLNNEE